MAIDLTQFTTFATMMVAISVADERVVEILKGAFPNFWLFTAKPDATAEARRNAALHFLAFMCGTAIAAVGRFDVLKTLSITWPTGSLPLFEISVSYLTAGLLASGGSAIWNHALDLLKAVKVKNEQDAISSFAANNKKGITDAIHPSTFAFAMAAAVPCRIVPGKPPIDFAATLGPISLLLERTNGNFDFVPSGCKVSDPNGADVPLSTSTPTQLAFDASAIGTYRLTVQYFRSDNSTAQLKENCGGTLILRALDSNVAPLTTYTFSIS